MSISNTSTHAPLIIGPVPEEATGEVAKLYAMASEVFGTVPDAARLLALNPVVLANQVRYIGYFRNHPRLSRTFLAAVRLLVAQYSNCRYCVDMNTAMLVNGGWTMEQVQSAKADFRTAPLAGRELALLEVVLRAVDKPSSLRATDMDALRAHGWSDEDIFDAVHHGAQNRANDTVLDAFHVTSY